MASRVAPRRPPWLSGTLLLAAVALLLLAAGWRFGLRRWPHYLGLGAVLLLALGALESAWRSRPLPRLPRARTRRHFQVLTGGKARKGNGEAHDGPDSPHDDGDKPRWVM